MRALLLLTLWLSAGQAQKESFDARVVSVGPPAGFLCGHVMATQSVRIAVTRVQSGALHAGDTTDVRVMTCTTSSFVRMGKQALELDPRVVHPGATLHFDGERENASLLVTSIK